MIKIGDFAKICNVSTQTLRYYDAEGVLKPNIVDSSSGYRFYSIEAIEKYKQIIFYKNLGFSLEDIKKVQKSTPEECQVLLQKRKIFLLESIETIKKQIKKIDEICDRDFKKTNLSEALIIPFEDDVQAVGKWQLCGKLIDENELTFSGDIEEFIGVKDIIFMPGGAFSWKFFWTKGTLYRISPSYTFAIPNPYRIIEKNGVLYMIVDFMRDECIDCGEETVLLLYRKIDNKSYTEWQMRSNIDKTDLPFVDDELVHGEWKVVDFVSSISDFSQNYQRRNDKLYVDCINFFPRGICTRSVNGKTGNVTYSLRYTKGFVLNDKERTAEEYIIKLLNGKQYLFVQHKSGDYYYGGMMPCWYVFERKDNKK